MATKEAVEAKALATGNAPNLRPVRVTTWFHEDEAAFDATLWINNDGATPSLGKFEITFGYSYYDYSQDPPLFEYHERHVEVPTSTDVQPGGTNPFEFPNISYVRKPGTSRAPYTFYASVDSEGEIAESDESDNNLMIEAWLRPPLVPRPKVGPAHQ